MKSQMQRWRFSIRDRLIQAGLICLMLTIWMWACQGEIAYTFNSSADTLPWVNAVTNVTVRSSFIADEAPPGQTNSTGSLGFTGVFGPGRTATFGGLRRSFPSADLTHFANLEFDVKVLGNSFDQLGQIQALQPTLGLTATGTWSQSSVQPQLTATRDNNGWQHIVIPLTSFSGNLKDVRQLFLNVVDENFTNGTTVQLAFANIKFSGQAAGPSAATPIVKPSPAAKGPATVFKGVYNATVSDTDQQTIKGFGGSFPWYRVGTPLNDYPLAAQAVLEMGPSVMRITWHNQYNVYNSSGGIANTALMDTMVSQIKWAASHSIPYQLSPGWNCLPRSCYDGKGVLFQQYEQALCDSVTNTLNYFKTHGCPLPVMTTLANEPNVPIAWMSPVPIPQFHRVHKLLRKTLINTGLSGLKLGYAENGEMKYTLDYLGGPGFPALTSDPDLNLAIDAFVTHTYYPSTTFHQQYADGLEAIGANRDRWQTEYCYNGDGVMPGKDHTTGLIERFISDLAFLKLNYWELWQIWNQNGPAGTDTLLAGNGKTAVVKPSAYYVLKKIWTNALPGSRVRRVTSSDPALISNNNTFMDAIAFVDETKMVVVLVNPKEARSMDVKGVTGASAKVYQIATGAPDNTEMALTASPAVSDGTIANVSLAANSVTVIVTSGGARR